MRNTIIGLVLAAMLLGGLFFAATHSARRGPGPEAAGTAPSAAAIKAAAAKVGRGFVGAARVGYWTVVCEAAAVTVGASPAAADKPPLPLSLGAAAPPKPEADSPKLADSTATTPAAGAAQTAAGPGAKPAAAPLSLGRCRASFIIRRQGQKGAIALVSFRLVGTSAPKVGLIVRLAAGKKGDPVALRLGKGALKLAVSGCSKGGCLAAGVLETGSFREILAAPRRELVLPPNAKGQRPVALLPAEGLGASLAAIRRAEN